ncbi:MAG: hypothetical protein J7J99_01755 [Thermoprotei archaeon]|nr:hypothetical protein [Thermoprotei archaeon]
MKAIGYLSLIFYLLFALFIFNLLDFVMAIEQGKISIEPNFEVINNKLLIRVNSTNNSFHKLELRVEVRVGAQKKSFQLLLNPGDSKIDQANITLAHDVKFVNLTIIIIADEILRMNITKSLEVRN